MKKYINWISVIILLLVIIGTTIFLKNCTYTNDDWWTAFFDRDFIELFLLSDQGLVLSWFTMKICAHTLPEIFHMHPQQNILMSIIKGINVALLIFIFSKFFNLKDKKNPNPIIIIFNTIILFSIFFLVDVSELMLINVHFKYLFNLVLGFMIWAVWYKEFLNDEFLLNKNRLRDCIFSIILVFCGHLVNIPSIIMFSSLLMYKIHSKNLNEIYENFKKLVKNIYPMVLVYIVGILAYLNLPGFKIVREHRVPQESILYYSMTHFSNFSEKFFQNIFSNYYIYALFILTIVGFIGLFIFKKKIDKKYIIISLSIFVANFVFMYSLLTCGTTYYDNKSYWFASIQIMFTFLFYLILCCNIIYGCLYRLIDKRKCKILFILVCFALINIAYPANIVINAMKSTYYYERNQQIYIYKLNKIFRYYALKGDTIYVPKDYDIGINAILGGHVLYFAIKNMELLYKTNPKKFIIMDKIINENELFTEEELRKIDFKKLYDDNFILQMKEPKFSEE